MANPTRKTSGRKPARKKATGGGRGARKVCTECQVGKGKHLPGCSQAGCELCHARVGHQPDCPEYDGPVTEIVEGARYQSAGGDEVLVVKKIAGDVVHYTIEGHDVDFSERRVRFREIVTKRLPDGTRKLRTTIDGHDAELVIDGTSGKVLKSGDQATLLQEPLENLVHQLVKQDEVIADLSSRRGAISNQLKTAKERREEILAEIKHRDPSKPGLFIPDPSDADLEDDEDEDVDED